jgi:hypothetical protein
MIRRHRIKESIRKWEWDEKYDNAIRIRACELSQVSNKEMKRILKLSKGGK